MKSTHKTVSHTPRNLKTTWYNYYCYIVKRYSHLEENIKSQNKQTKNTVGLFTSSPNVIVLLKIYRNQVNYRWSEL